MIRKQAIDLYQGLPKVLIVGRPNVGKSSLFNRLVGRRQSLVHNQSGVTRDAIYKEVALYEDGSELRFCLIDSAGLEDQPRFGDVRSILIPVIQSAQLLLLVWDGQVGPTPEDLALVQWLREHSYFGCPRVVGIVNKIDVDSHESRIAEFHEIGLDPILGLSAEHNRGIEELRSEIFESLKGGLKTPVKKETKTETPEWPRISVVGRPNVGKSTLINTLMGKKVAHTSPIPGTTIDSVESHIKLAGQNYRLVDTAGIKKKNRTHEDLEILSTLQALEALDRSQLTVLVLDGQQGPQEQDRKIISEIEKRGVSFVIFVNKWDVFWNRSREKTKFIQKTALEHIHHVIPFIQHVPILFGSALRGEGIDPIGKALNQVWSERLQRINTRELTDWVRSSLSTYRNRKIRFFYCHQSSVNPPTFVCHVNRKENVRVDLKRYLAQGLRKKWGYSGTPIRLKLINRTKVNRISK